MGRILKRLGVAGMVILAFSTAVVAYASAATLSKMVTQNEKPVPECKFVKVGDKCQIKFTVTGEGEGWRVEGNEFKGEKAEVRYKKTVGCTVGKLLKDKETCTDEIEMVKEEKGTMNEWCVLWELEGGKLKKVPFCTKLAM